MFATAASGRCFMNTEKFTQASRSKTRLNEQRLEVLF